MANSQIRGIGNKETETQERCVVQKVLIVLAGLAIGLVAVAALLDGMAALMARL